MKKVYITGIAGLLGSNLVNILQQNYQVYGADIVDVGFANVNYDHIDLSNVNELRQSILTYKPDVLIHTVAIVNVDLCEEDVNLAERINVILTKNIYEICEENHIKMIYISSDSVFDGTSEKLYDEQDKVGPLNVYAKTKYEGECWTLKNKNNLVLRTNIYGLNLQKKNSFGEWVINELEQDHEINMFTDIDFSPILVTDLACIIDKCIQNSLCGLYHVCATGAITKYEFGVYLKEQFGIKSGIIKKNTSDVAHFKAQRPKHMGLSNKKICDDLKLSIRTPRESIDEFMKQVNAVRGKKYGN